MDDDDDDDAENLYRQKPKHSLHFYDEVIPLGRYLKVVGV